MADNDEIERCAELCDTMVKELESAKPNSRTSQYDRQSPRQIDYAIRAVRRVAERIRALKSLAHKPRELDGDADKLEKALMIAKELRPIIARTKDSAWKQDMLRRLNELTD